MARKPTDEVQLKLRFSEALRKKLANSADQAGRSLNAEIIHRLEQSYETKPVTENEKNLITQIAMAAATSVLEQAGLTQKKGIPIANFGATDKKQKG